MARKTAVLFLAGFLTLIAGVSLAEEHKRYDVTLENIKTLPVQIKVQAHTYLSGELTRFCVAVSDRRIEEPSDIDAQLVVRGPYFDILRCSPQLGSKSLPNWYRFDLEPNHARFSDFVVTVYYKGADQHSEVYRIQLGSFLDGDTRDQ